MAYDQSYTGTPENDNIDIPSLFPDLVNETWRIDAKAGDDTVVGGLNNDLIYGKEGKDEINANDGDDTVYGGSDNDTIHGGDGLDFLFGEDGNDEIHGDAGDDRINGGAGADIMYGGLGDDIFWVDNVGDRVIENAGEGRDRVISSLDSYFLADNVERLYLIDDATYGYGNTLDNWLGGHKDTNATDKLYGRAGGDDIYGYGGVDYLYGEEGNDKVVGGDGDDELYGGDDDDRLYGEDGDDHLFGGIGQDYIDGGSGFDIYYSAHGSGITADLATDTVIVGERIGDSVIEYTETIKNIEGIVATDLRRGDNLYGDDQHNILDGKDGQDKLYGRGGNDTLLGGNWDDYLHGGDGNDTLTGGSYHDIFAFKNLSEGVDTITDFSEEDSDYIQISKSGFGASSQDQFIYNLGSGALYFDASPFDNVDPTVFAILSNKPADFSITRAIALVD